MLPGYGTAVLDLASPAVRVVVEIDGWAYHRDLPAFRRDQAARTPPVLAGWTVLRINWHEIEGDADAILAVVEAALAA